MKTIITILLFIVSLYGCKEKKSLTPYTPYGYEEQPPHIAQSIEFDSVYILNTTVYYWGAGGTLGWREQFRPYSNTIKGDFNFIKNNKVIEFKKALPTLNHIQDSIAGITKIQLAKAAKDKIIKDSITLLNNIKP